MSLDTEMTVAEPTTDEVTASAPRSRRGMVIGLVVGLLAIAAAAALGKGWFSAKSADLTDEEIEALRAEAERNVVAATPAETTSKSGKTALVAKRAAAAAEHDQQVAASMLGDWELFDEGRYQLTLNADHTGKLIYKPDGFKNKTALALWSGELKIDIRWSVKNGLVEMSSISGTPKFAFTVATESRGKRKLYKLKDLNEKRLVLFELKNGKTDNWRKLD
jgi:hypothetical protein